VNLLSFSTSHAGGLKPVQRCADNVAIRTTF
jgi:hypothetical protein